jgi:hypothetical protein
MEEQLTRIADSFERIASTLEWIQRQGLELYSKSGCLQVHIDVDDVPLSGDVAVCMGRVDLEVELKNGTIGFETVPFVIEQS